MNGEFGTSLSLPFGDTENTDTVLLFGLPVASRPPSGLNATESGNEATKGEEVPLTANGEPGTWLRLPFGATENTDTVLLASFAVASSPPAGLTASENESWAAANGEPGTWVKAGEATAPDATAKQHRHAKAATPNGRNIRRSSTRGRYPMRTTAPRRAT